GNSCSRLSKKRTRSTRPACTPVGVAGKAPNGTRLRVMVTIAELLQARSEVWRLKLIAGTGGLANGVSIPRIQKPGLALAGYLPQIHPERVQVIGRTELGYLATLADDVARRAVDRMLAER